MLVHDCPFRYMALIPTLLTGPGLTTVSVKVPELFEVPGLYLADTICILGLLDVDARNVVYMYQPTATAITIIIASSIASSIDVRPFIGVEYLFTYKFCVVPRRTNGGGSRRTRPFSTGRLGLFTRFRPARRVGLLESARRRRRRRLSAPSMRPEALRDAVTRAARRRRPLDCLRRAAPWAGRRRGGLGGGRESPAVVFVMSTGGDADGLPSSDRVHRLGPESSRPQVFGVSGLRGAEILGRAPTGGCRTACYILHAL